MPNQFFFYRDDYQIQEDIEEHFATDYWLFEQFVGDQMFAWGSNEFGKIGTETSTTSPITYRSTPRQEFTSSTNWRQVSCGRHHTLAIKTDGTLWAWGYNSNGQLGDNTYSQRVTPRQIGTDTNWKQVAGGSFHSSAVKTDGTLWVWGYNFYGQLGDNTRTDKLTPIREINSSTNWKQVTAGDSFCSAIKTDGTLWAWGRNTSAHLGDNSFSSRSTPRQIGTDTNWKQVFAGPTSAHAQAIKTNGTLWAWGNNFYGQLGDNTRATRSTPRQIGTDTNWKQVAGGGNHSLAIKTNGTLWGWGYNFYGQVGDNTSGNLNPARSTPRQIGTDTNWKQVAAGHNHCSAIKTDGTLWNWGRGFAVADNSTTSRSTPRQEFSLSANWKQVSGGYNHSLGVKTGIGMDVTPIGIYYSNYALTQGTRALIHGITAGAYPPSDYFGSWIGIQNSTSDDASLQISLPFTWYINNVGETAVRIVSNSYLTFGTTSYTNYSGLSASVPAVSKIHIGAADNSYQRISYLSNPNFLRIRFEGNCSTSGVVGNPGIVFEVTLFNPSLFGNNSYVEIRTGTHCRTNGQFGIASPSSYYSSSTISENQSYVFAGNSTGTAFTLYSGYYIS